MHMHVCIHTGHTPFLATLLCIAWFPSLAPDSDTIAQVAGLLLGWMLGAGAVSDLLASPYWVSVWAGAMVWVLLLTRRAYPPRNIALAQRGAVLSRATTSSDTRSGTRAHRRNGIGNGNDDDENVSSDTDSSDGDDIEVDEEQVGLLEVPSPPPTTAAMTSFSSQHHRSWHASAADDARSSADLQHLEEGSPLLLSRQPMSSNDHPVSSRSRRRTWAQCSRRLLAADGFDDALALAVGEVHLRGWWPPVGAVDDTPSGRRIARKRQLVAEAEAVVSAEEGGNSEGGGNNEALSSAQTGSSSSSSSSSGEVRRRDSRAIISQSQRRDWADVVIEEDLLPTARSLTESAGVASASTPSNEASGGNRNFSRNFSDGDDGGGNTATLDNPGAVAWAEGVRDGMHEIGNGVRGALRELSTIIGRGASWSLRRMALWGAMLRQASAGGGGNGGLRVPRERESPAGSAPPSPGHAGSAHPASAGGGGGGGGGGAAARQRHHSAGSASGAFSGWEDDSSAHGGGTGHTEDAALAEAIRRSMEENA